MDIKKVVQKFAKRMNLFLKEIGMEEWWDIEGTGENECEYSREYLLSPDPGTESITRIKRFPDDSIPDAFFAGENQVKTLSDFKIFSSFFEVIEHLEEISGKKFVTRFE
jgi:hypothetical protein